MSAVPNLEMKKGVTSLIESTVVEVFNEMFEQDVRTSDLSLFADHDKDLLVFTGISLSEDKIFTDFSFVFDHRLLSLAARKIYPDVESGNQVYMLEDLACEITNIVCSKVKNYLNTQGYDTEMCFPFIDRSGHSTREGKSGATRIYFSYNAKPARNEVGLAVDFVVLITRH